MLQTCSKVQASQEAAKEVSKPYACQLLENASDTETQRLGDATPLRGVNVAIPMETMKDHCPELCDRIASDIDHKKSYDTAGLDCTTAQGAYSALPLRFGSLAVSAPAIVLPNENYEILIGILFMQQYGVKTDHENNILEILGQAILLYYNQTNPAMGSQTTPYVNLAYFNGCCPSQVL
ncbi:hypothetical protein DSO57_1005610 [Entomophthora muscae]|uniref:Uncharacterized protein n=1 Tax=Entomophthora muscae TaxID=34485 RepID=A0ACC2RML9_9FUNG|nr:hypothetical protein DSO57_1005610 [Entomophthora muscae]